MSMSSVAAGMTLAAIADDEDTPERIAAQVPEELRTEVAGILRRILAELPEDGAVRREAIAAVCRDLTRL